MIYATEALPIGNAIAVSYSLPAGAVYARLLRRLDGAIDLVTDPGTVLAADFLTGDGTVIDSWALANGVPVYYALSWWNGAAFTVTPAFGPTTPAASYRDAGVDPQELVRARFEAGFAVEVARGVLMPKSGAIAVLTAPFALATGIKLPVVSVHLESNAPQHRGIGEMFFGEAHEVGAVGGFDDVIDNTGYLSRMALNVVAVSLNPDERIAMRRAIGRIFKGNLGVFDAAGMVTIEFSQSDTEQFVENNAPLYLTTGVLSFCWPDLLLNDAPVIRTANATAIPFGASS